MEKRCAALFQFLGCPPDVYSDATPRHARSGASLPMSASAVVNIAAFTAYIFTTSTAARLEVHVPVFNLNQFAALCTCPVLSTGNRVKPSAYFIRNGLVWQLWPWM